jgi:xanthine dehydrogenase accessory factor
MFDLVALGVAIAAHGAVARVVIAAHDGSSPREVGAAMLVWADGQSGTIGGGALEWQALARARAMLLRACASAAPPVGVVGDGGTMRAERIALGPSLGQCCGGAVTVLTEVFARVPVADAGVVARSLDGSAMPLAVKRVLSRARDQGIMPAPALVQGWFLEPVAHVQRQVWIWGAGHVGRALVSVLAPLPGLAITWVDVAQDRFPDVIPDGVTVVPSTEPALLVAHVPKAAEHLVLTYSHGLDLDLCHRLLMHGFARLGLIGSATKWARFRSRLAALGHAPAAIARVDCPIGDPSLGKHPQAIAVGVAAALLAQPATRARQEQAK